MTVSTSCEAEMDMLFEYIFSSIVETNQCR